MICWGSTTGASRAGNVDAPGSASCGRIIATARAPRWAMQNMPIRRVMGDMLNLPTGNVLIINGAQNGYQGWGKAKNPVLSPVHYTVARRTFQVYEDHHSSSLVATHIYSTHTVEPIPLSYEWRPFLHRTWPPGNAQFFCMPSKLQAFSFLDVEVHLYSP